MASLRKLMGATDPAKADAGTIRKDFGESIERNAIHGSDSDENANTEIALSSSPRASSSRPARRGAGWPSLRCVPSLLLGASSEQSPVWTAVTSVAAFVAKWK